MHAIEQKPLAQVLRDKALLVVATRILRGVGCKVSAWEQWGVARDYQRAARPVAAYPAAAYPVAAWRCESVGNERVG